MVKPFVVPTRVAFICTGAGAPMRGMISHKGTDPHEGAPTGRVLSFYPPIACDRGIGIAFILVVKLIL